MSPYMTITLNGQPKNIASAMLLRDLVAQTSKKPEYIIAEVNGAIVDKASWAATTLRINDKVELISFVGGG